MGLPVELTLEPQSNGICELNGDKVKPVGVGICIINAFQKGDAITNPAQAVYQVKILPATFTETGKAKQVIIFQSPTNAMVNETISLEVVAGASGQPVVFSSDTPNVCTVSNAEVTLISVTLISEGICIIVAKQEGNENFDSTISIYQIPVTASSCLVLKGNAVITDNCDGGGQTILFDTKTFSENTHNSNLVLLHPVTNAGTLSNLTLNSGGAVDGGTLSGTINNQGQGVIQNVTLATGARLVGGKLVGKVVNNGLIENVTFSAHTEVSGGVLAGTLQADTPAFLDDLMIQDNASVNNVLLGANVRLGNNVTLGNEVYHCRPQAMKVDASGQITDYSSAKFCFNLPIGSPVTKDQVTPLTAKILLGMDDRNTETTEITVLGFYNQQYYIYLAHYPIDEKFPVWFSAWESWDGKVSSLATATKPTLPIIGAFEITKKLQDLPADNLFYLAYRVKDGLIFDNWGTSTVIHALSTAQV